MALFQSNQVKAQKALPAARDGVATVAVTTEFVIPAGLALNDIIEMGGIPAGHIPVDVVVSFPDTDSNGTPLVAFDAGIISGRFGDPVLGSRACGNEFFAADTTARAGGIARANKSLAGVAPKLTEQGWGLKVQAAAATLATGGTVRATLFLASAPDQVAFA